MVIWEQLYLATGRRVGGFGPSFTQLVIVPSAGDSWNGSTLPDLSLLFRNKPQTPKHLEDLSTFT